MVEPTTCLVSFNEASRLIAAHAKPLGVEYVPLDYAEQRVLARAAIAPDNSPASLVSAMDGYAVHDGDLSQLPAALPIASKSFAGSPPGAQLPPGACIRIFTGAPAPEGTDRIVVQEDVHEENGMAFFGGPLSGRRHLRLPGSDFVKGDVIVSVGSLLTAQRLIGVAACDVAGVDVFRQPQVAIICCGDELREPGSTTQVEGKTPESISYGVAALVRHWGGRVVARWRAPDELSSLQAAASEALSSADVTVIIAGASVGEKDLAKQALIRLQWEPLFSNVAIKPGKPAWFGRAGEKLVLGLPGNPASALVTARLFLAPLVAGLSGRRIGEALDWQPARMTTTLAGCPNRDVFILATMAADGAQCIAVKDSIGQRALAAATHLIWQRSGRLPAGAGTIVETLTL